MEDREKAIRELHEKIEEIARQQKQFQQDIQKLQNAIFELNLSEMAETKSPPTPRPVEKIEPKETPKEVVPQSSAAQKVSNYMSSAQQPKSSAPPVKKVRTPIEEFIGTNLLNKVGIAVLVAGIGFGAKYSIDHDLINPLTRIILGYVAGLALIVLALRLKKAHLNFSAVLLSGGMAVLYFITYAAYDFYQPPMIPQAMAFALMVVFTAFTVVAAIQYDKEVIGIIGLVGAYAVPFLLSDGSGRVVILFSYISIINTGILILAFRKDWKRLYYLAFTLTWLSFAAWYGFSFNEEEHLWISLIFSTIFFLTFYTTFLSYKLIRKEPLSKLDVIFMLLNSFLYFGYGYSAIDDIVDGDQYLGLFTLFTAVIHFIAVVIIYKNHNQYKDIFYFVAGLVLTFLTLAVPVQLEGNWVTLIWALEAAVLFWIGRTKGFAVYEKLSYPLVILAFGSLLHDWDSFYLENYYYAYDYVERPAFLLNIQFLTTAIVTICLSIILWISFRKQFSSPYPPQSAVFKIFSFGLPLIVLVVAYLGIFKEVEAFWDQRYATSGITTRGDYGEYKQYDEDLQHFKILWLINYSAIFALVFSLIQMKFIKAKESMVASILINAVVIFAFVTAGLFEISQLRYSYLNQLNSEYYFRDGNHILIRYIGIVLIIPLMFINFKHIRQTIFPEVMRQGERVLFHTAVLILLSSELVHWLDMFRIENSFKLALSILWGSYALFLIVFGLWKDLKYIRVAAIVLFAITLIKLFLYDMADMTTISKTIVMIILGALLLTASFLYNKYKRSTGNETL